MDATQDRVEVIAGGQAERLFFPRSIVRQLIPLSRAGQEVKGRSSPETRAKAGGAEVGKPILHQRPTQRRATVLHRAVVHEMGAIEVAQAVEAVEEVAAVGEAVVVVAAAEDLDNMVVRKHH